MKPPIATITYDPRSDGDPLLHVALQGPEDRSDLAAITVKLIWAPRCAGPETVDYTWTFSNPSFVCAVFEQPLAGFRGYTLLGINLRIFVTVAFELTSGETIRQEIPVVMPKKPTETVKARDVVWPADDINWRRNWATLPTGSRQAVTIVAGLTTLSVAVGEWISLDPGLWEGSKHLPSRYMYPAARYLALVMLAALGFAWWFFKSMLASWARIRLRPVEVRPAQKYRLRDLVDGEARTAFDRATIRVLAYNIESVDGEDSQGRSTRATLPFNPVVLFEKPLPAFSAGDRFSDLLDDEQFSFDEMFERLLPPARGAGDLEVEAHWQVQVIHPDFRDIMLDSTAVAGFESFVTGPPP